MHSEHQIVSLQFCDHLLMLAGVAVSFELGLGYT